MLHHPDLLMKIENEDKKVVGNTYIVKKQYQGTIIWFIAKLESKYFYVGTTFYGSAIHYYYFEDYYIYEIDGNPSPLNNANSTYRAPYTAYVPDSQDVQLYSVEFYRIKPMPLSIQNQIRRHAFLRVKPEFERKTKIPSLLIHFLVEEYI
jgi:hypothetical protein